MNMNIGFEQNLNVSQQLNLAPQLLNWLRLLQSSTTDLSDLVQHELETNPALEVGADAKDKKTEASGDTQTEKTEAEREKETQLDEKCELLANLESEWSDEYSPSSASSSAQDIISAQERHQYAMDTISAGESIQEHLMAQLPLAGIADCDLETARLIIGSIDSAGYLDASIDDLSMLSGIPEDDIESVLRQVQKLDPAGAGARDLRECLLLQLDVEHGLGVERAIVSEHLEALAQQRYEAIAEAMDVDLEDVLDAADTISALTPTPGKSFTKERTNLYITPDVRIYKKEDEYKIDLNDDYIPHLRVSASCKRMIERKDLTAADLTYIRNKIRSAVFLMQGITQRQDTLRKVTEQIVNFQMEFIDEEEGRLQPLTMAKVAGIIGVHETTVSRALANKYIETPKGVFEMKHFFKAGYRCADGSAMTPEAVKEIISELIDEEEPSSPRRDIDIVDILKKKGLRLARRTVAKYRGELGIPSSKERAKESAASGKPGQVIQMPAASDMPAVA